MPRYHFNVYDGRSLLDTDGIELPDFATARLEAVRLAGMVVHDEAERLIACMDWRLELTSDTGVVLFRLDFNVQRPAAAVGEGGLGNWHVPPGARFNPTGPSH